MRKFTKEEVEAKINEVFDDSYGVINFNGMSNKSKVIHNKCGFIFEQNATTLANGRGGCPVCNLGTTQTTESFKQRVYNEVVDEYSVMGEYINASEKILMRHNNCCCEEGFYEWYIVPNQFISGGHRCPVESHQVKITTEMFINIAEKKNPNLEIMGDYVNADTNIDVRCKTCSNVFKTTPYKITHGLKCPYCTNHLIKKGFNDISTTHPNVFELMLDKEFGYSHSIGTTSKTDFKCSCCGNIINTIPSLIFNNLGMIVCPSCKDGFPYPEKFMYNMLKQLGIEFKYQLTSADFKWCGKYRYDFYLTRYNTIIEVHGGQHYRDTNWNTKEEIQKIDKTKKEIALKNGISNYIEIDCRISDSDFIKNNILKSELNNIFNLEDFDWNKCAISSTNNILKLVCDRWDNVITVPEMAKLFDISDITIRRYLEQGNELGLCDFNGEEYNKRINIIKHEKINKTLKRNKIYCHELNKVFESQSQAHREVKFNWRKGLMGNPNRTSQGMHWSYLYQLSEDFIKENNITI